MAGKLRVIHCGTGVAGRQALKAILTSPQLELVGLLLHGERHEKRRAAEIAGVDVDCAVLGTRDLGALLEIEADVVCDMLLIPDHDRIAAFLERGCSVVTTAGLIFPKWGLDAIRERLQAACVRGRSSFYVTGINPGWVGEILPLTMSVLTRRIERLHIHEYADCARYPAPHILSVMGFGRTREDVEEGRLPDMAVMRDFFTQSIAALAHGLDCALDEVVESREFAYAPKDYTIAAGDIGRGTIAGQRWTWRGRRAGVDRIVQETFWITAFDLGEGWPKTGEYDDDTQWRVTLEGTPSLRCTFQPRYSFLQRTLEDAPDFNPSGLATAMAAVNSLAPVHAARPGLLTSIDLPLPRCRQIAHA